VYVDPTMEEESKISGTFMISHMPNMNRITHIIQSGVVNTDQAVEVIIMVNIRSQIWRLIVAVRFRVLWNKS
jgi:hypothetical protein